MLEVIIFTTYDSGIFFRTYLAQFHFAVAKYHERFWIDTLGLVITNVRRIETERKRNAGCNI